MLWTTAKELLDDVARGMEHDDYDTSSDEGYEEVLLFFFLKSSIV